MPFFRSVLAYAKLDTTLSSAERLEESSAVHLSRIHSTSIEMFWLRMSYLEQGAAAQDMKASSMKTINSCHVT